MNELNELGRPAPASTSRSHSRTSSRRRASPRDWTGSGGYGVGPVYVTAVNLTILQLEKGILPIYQR